MVLGKIFGCSISLVACITANVRCGQEITVQAIAKWAGLSTIPGRLPSLGVKQRRDGRQRLAPGAGVGKCFGCRKGGRKEVGLGGAQGDIGKRDSPEGRAADLVCLHDGLGRLSLLCGNRGSQRPTSTPTRC